LGLNFNSIGYAILFLLAIVFAGLTWYEVDKTVELDGLGRDLVKFFSLGSLLVTFIWFSRVYIWPYLKAVRKYNLLKQEAEEVVELELPTLIPEPENASEKEKQRIRARNKVVLEQFFRGFGKYDGVDMKTFAVAEDERDSIKAAINTGDYKLANELLQNAYGTFMEQFEQDYGSTKRKKKRLPRNPLESTRKKKKPGV
jgi:hypothetical protein